MEEKSKKTFLMIIETIGIAISGAIFFIVIQLPLPWLLGPVCAVLVWPLTTKRTLYCPPNFRNMALLMLGYMLGSSFTSETIYQIIRQLPYMIVTNVLIILLSFWIGFIISRRTQTDILSVIFGSIPGGLSQILAIGEELKGINLSVALFMQTIRVLSVIIFVPLFAIHGFGANADNVHGLNSTNSVTNPHLWYQYILYGILPFLGAWAGKRIGLPTSILTGPLIATAIAMMITGDSAPPLPPLLLIISQLAIGMSIGLQLKPHKLKGMKKLGIYSVSGSLILIFFSLLLGYGLTKVSHLGLSTAFLGIAPGGIAEMGITATTIHADLSMVTGYQMFRVLLTVFLIPPILKWWIQRKRKNKLQSTEEVSR